MVDKVKRKFVDAAGRALLVPLVGFASGFVGAVTGYVNSRVAGKGFSNPVLAQDSQKATIENATTVSENNSGEQKKVLLTQPASSAGLTAAEVYTLPSAATDPAETASETPENQSERSGPTGNA